MDLIKSACLEVLKGCFNILAQTQFFFCLEFLIWVFDYWWDSPPPPTPHIFYPGNKSRIWIFMFIEWFLLKIKRFSFIIGGNWKADSEVCAYSIYIYFFQSQPEPPSLQAAFRRTFTKESAQIMGSVRTSPRIWIVWRLMHWAFKMVRAHL